MKTKLIVLTSVFMFAITSCNNVDNYTMSGSEINVRGTKVNIFYIDSFHKNRRMDIKLAVWDNTPRMDGSHASSSIIDNLSQIICSVRKGNPNFKFHCFGIFDKKTGKEVFEFAGEKFNLSNGRLFLVNTREKPIKVIQVNEQFKDVFPTEKDFNSLAKKNKIIANFLNNNKRE